MTRGFHFDLNLCTGCHACRLACTVENGLPWGASWRNVHEFNPGNDPRLPLFHLSLACNHCDGAPCMASCPALAYRRDEATGAVLIEADRCLGCRYCSWACPYDAPLYSPADGVMTKCTLCEPRVAAGREPACVDYCPTGALGFGELDGPGPDETARERKTGNPVPDRLPMRRDRTVPGFEEHGIGPRIRFAPLRDERWTAAGRGEAPAGSAPPGTAGSDRRTARTAAVPSPGGTAGASAGGTERRLLLRAEWPLLAFTLLAAVSVSVFSAGSFGERTFPWTAWLLPALAGLGLSLSHLGRPARAWRAALNVRRSWVSREIAAFGLFLLFAALSAPGLGGFAGWEPVAVLLGFFALWAMDRVYTTVRAAGAPKVHSAEVFDTGLYLVLWLSGWPVLAGAVGLYKTVLFLWRRARTVRRGGPAAPAAAAARVALGFAVPVGLALDRPEAWPLLAFAFALAGEIVDRIEFYAGFTLAAPRGSLEAERMRRQAVGPQARQGV